MTSTVRISQGSPSADTLKVSTTPVPDAAQQAALARAGLSQSGFQSQPATARRGAAGTTNGQTQAPPNGASVTAAQLQNGATSLDAMRVKSDTTPYPNGNSADSIVSQFVSRAAPDDLAGLMAANGNQPAVSKQVIIDTVVSALVPEQRQAALNLIKAGVSDASLARAFSAVVEARKTPGEKTLDLNLVPVTTETVPFEEVGWHRGDDSTGFTQTRTVEGKPVPLQAKMTVDASGTVNGAQLAADLTTRINTTLAKVPPEFRDKTLSEVGLSQEWITYASPEQKDYALAQIIAARSNSPGTKVTLDFSYDHTFVRNWNTKYGAQHSERTETLGGSITLDIDAQGQIGGKPLEVDKAFAVTKIVEQMPTETRRASLMEGVPADPVKGTAADPGLQMKAADVAAMSSAEIEYANIKLGMAKAFSPGKTTGFDYNVGGERWHAEVQVGEDHQIKASCAYKIPPPPKKKKKWGAIISIVCAVVSICCPVLAPVCQVINAVSAVASGQKGLGLIAAIAGGVAGGMALGSIANTMSATGAGFMSAAGSYQAAAQGLAAGMSAGAIAESSMAAGQLTNTGWALAGAAQTAGSVAQMAGGLGMVQTAVKNGDMLGAAAGLLSVGASGVRLAGGPTTLSSSLNSYARVTSSMSAVDKAAKTGDAMQIAAAATSAAAATNKELGLGLGKEVEIAARVAVTANSVSQARKSGSAIDVAAALATGASTLSDAFKLNVKREAETVALTLKTASAINRGSYIEAALYGVGAMSSNDRRLKANASQARQAAVRQTPTWGA